MYVYDGDTEIEVTNPQMIGIEQSGNGVERFDNKDEQVDNGDLYSAENSDNGPISPFGLRFLMRLSILLIIAATLCSLIFSSNIGINTILHLCVGIFLIAVSGILIGQYMKNPGQLSKVNRILGYMVILFTVLFLCYALYLLFSNSGNSASYRYAALLAIMGLILTAAVSGNILRTDLGESL